MPAPKSFYHLYVLVAPGGASLDLHFVRGTLAEIRQDFADEIEAELDMYLYLLCWYGAEVKLEAYPHGEHAGSVDLHRFIEISIDGYPTITFDDHNKTLGHDFKAGPDEHVEAGSLASRMFNGTLGDSARITVAWERMNLPALAGEVVGADDVVTLEGDWRGDDDVSREDLIDDGWLPVGVTYQ